MRGNIAEVGHVSYERSNNSRQANFASDPSIVRHATRARSIVRVRRVPVIRDATFRRCLQVYVMLADFMKFQFSGIFESTFINMACRFACASYTRSFAFQSLSIIRYEAVSF